MLSSLCRVDIHSRYPQVLVLSPTYELAIQTGEVAKQMAKHQPNLTFKFAVRGEELERGTSIQDQVLFGTPGKVMDWALRWRFFDIKKIKVINVFIFLT